MNWFRAAVRGATDLNEKRLSWAAYGTSDTASVERLLEAATAFNSSQPTPDLVTSVFREIWRVRGDLVDLSLTVPPCPYSAERLDALQRASRRVGYLPLELSRQDTTRVFGQMYHRLKLNPGRSAKVASEPCWGWFDYESTPAAAHLNTTEIELAERFHTQGKRGLTLNEYIVAGYDTKLFAGEFFDLHTWSRLLGSRRQGGRTIHASFDVHGTLYFLWYLPDRLRKSDIGARSAEILR